MNYQEPELAPPKSVDPPKGLTGAGLAEWKKQIAHLIERGVLTDADLTAFEDYCLTLTRLRTFEAMAKKAGPELSIAKGYEGAAIKLRAQANQLRQQCGLTPSSRSNVRAAKKDAGPSTNPAERYLRALPGGKSA